MTCVFKAHLFGTTSVLIFSLVTNSKHPLILVPFGLLSIEIQIVPNSLLSMWWTVFGVWNYPFDQILSSLKPGSMIYTPFCGPKYTPSYSIQKNFKDLLTASLTIFSHFPSSVLPFILSPSCHHSPLFLSAAHKPQTNSTQAPVIHTSCGPVLGDLWFLFPWGI